MEKYPKQIQQTNDKLEKYFQSIWKMKVKSFTVQKLKK